MFWFILNGIFVSLVSFVSLIIIIWFYNDFRHRFAKNAPPLVTNWLPYIGMGLEYKNDPVAFIKKYRKIYNSEILCVYMGGRYITFVPSNYNHNSDNFFRLQKQVLSFSPIAELFTERVFDAPFYVNGSSLSDEFHQIYKKFLLSGAGLKQLTERFNSCLSVYIKPKNFSNEWVTHDDLLTFMFNILWNCSNQSLFFEEFVDEEMREKFKYFDDQLYKIVQASSMPTSMIRNMFKKEYSDWTDLFKYGLQFYSNGELNQPDVSDFMKARVKAMKDNNWSHANMVKSNNIILWGSLANTVPAAFWALANVIGNAKAKLAVENEISSIFAEDNGKTAQDAFTFDKLSKLKMTQSCFNETLRIYFNGPAIRKIIKTSDIQFKNNDKMQTFRFLREDLTMLSTNVTHYDEDIFKNPYEFVYDRFVTTDKFYNKGGEKLKKPLVAFGGGVSQCPGREFASGEIKLAFLHFFNLFDIELLDKIPNMTFDRIGLGIQAPEKKLPFRIKLRDQPLVRLSYD